MAITKTTSVQRIEVYPPADSSADDTANAKHETLMVVYEDTLDDSTDDDLPVTATRVKHLSKYQSDGGDATDYSGEDALVQTVCGAIWS
jgi:hypothetical protein|tara:strand:+ start:225 stop:491 length:267 start_codon:yes stop_codon:yes gene_type:complete